jgi:nucleoside phosphorylase
MRPDQLSSISGTHPRNWAKPESDEISKVKSHTSDSRPSEDPGKRPRPRSCAKQELGKTSTESRVDFLIITALPKEFDAVRQRFDDVQPVDDIYSTTVNYPNGKYRLILACQLYPGQQEAAALTATLCERYKPHYVLLVGIAGGNKEKVEQGDIIVANVIEDCTRGKIVGNSKWQPTWNPFNIEAELIRKVRALPNDWHESIKVKRPDKKKRAPETKEGVIVSGGNVIKEKAKGQWLERIKARNSNWLGVEMEGGGMATAIANYAGEPKPKFLMIRCVTDFANEVKDDKWHPYACDVAAAYTYAFLKSGPVPALNEIPSELTRADG